MDLVGGGRVVGGFFLVSLSGLSLDDVESELRKLMGLHTRLDGIVFLDLLLGLLDFMACKLSSHICLSSGDEDILTN